VTARITSGSGMPKARKVDMTPRRSYMRRATSGLTMSVESVVGQSPWAVAFLATSTSKWTPA